MKKIAAAIMLTLPLCIGSAFAEEKKPHPQHARMAECNKDATGKTGDERKAFMKTCLGDKKAAQQDKMKTCNKDAEGKTGDERKKFMSECLKK